MTEIHMTAVVWGRKSGCKDGSLRGKEKTFRHDEYVQYLWLWDWFHRCIHMSKFIEFYTLNMCSSLDISYTR